MNISEDKIFEDITKSARDSHSALNLAEQMIQRFDRFEQRFDDYKRESKEEKEKTRSVLREEVLAVKDSIFQDRDRYYEKKDKPVLEALESLTAKFNEMNTWKAETDSEIRSAKKWLKGIIITIGSYFGINIKGF